MAGKIVGLRQWRFVMAGELPPGITDEQVTAWVLSNLSCACTFTPFIRSQMVDIVPQTAGPRLES